MKKTTIYGIFDDEEVLLSSVKEIRSNEIHIKEVYSPFPVHGLDKALGLKETRMAITAFIYGCIGLTFGLALIYYIMISGIYKSWPMNIGGKPNWTLYHNLPAFVPVLFELTVLFAGHLMSITFFIRCGLFPGNPDVSPDPRTTDDKFLMEIEVDGDISKVKKMLTKTGATEINLKE
ncbi:MAG: DUF3341 domain-containing protein [Bacteroidota bacterium]|nr:DUF3341 domain-containing protein [Bacteroidota bacterium]|tara:strand:- start:389 stop:919 length:531 start_codon:yes stop_codon:yes gene_type:complete